MDIENLYLNFKILWFMQFKTNNSRRIKLRKKILKKRNEVLLNIQKDIIKQNNTLNQLFMNYITNSYINFDLITYKRSLWMKTRSTDFWDRIVLLHYDNAEWIESFRMTKITFLKLCSLLRTNLEPKETHLSPRPPVSVEKQVAIALYKLASCCEYRVVGNVFGVHKSTVKKCFYRVVNAINLELLKVYIFMPDVVEAQEIASQFEQASKIPQIIGCIDGSHVPILPPEDGFRDYVNRKGWASYNFQAVVDNNGRFRDICCKHPGNTHDATVLKDSGLFRKAVSILPQNCREFHGIKIPFMIIGDPAYPLLDWLMKGYPGSVTPEQESFNVHLNMARVSVEQAFGRLKGRWRILLKRIDVHHTFVPDIIAACCILHNFVELEKEMFLLQWLKNVEDSELIFQQPEQLHNKDRNSITGAEIRSHLTNYLATNFPLLKTIRL